MSADHRGLALRGTADKQLVGIGPPASGLRYPGDSGFGLGALQDATDGRSTGPTRCGPAT